MGNSFNGNTEHELRAHVQLIQSHMKKKFNINYHLNLSKIYSSYKYNSDYKRIKETNGLYKEIIANFQRVKKKKLTINYKDSREIINRCIYKQEIKDEIKQPDNETNEIMNDLLENQRKNAGLKEKLKDLQEKLLRKKQIYKENNKKNTDKICDSKLLNTKAVENQESRNKMIKLNEPKKTTKEYNKKKSELFDHFTATTNESFSHKRISYDTKSDSDSFSFENDFPKYIPNEIHCKIAELLKNAKHCLFLKENALQLKSKLALKQQLKKKVKIIKKEIEKGFEQSIYRKKQLENHMDSDKIDETVQENILDTMKMQISMLEDNILRKEAEKDYLELSFKRKRFYDKCSSQSAMNVSRYSSYDDLSSSRYLNPEKILRKIILNQSCDFLNLND